MTRSSGFVDYRHRLLSPDNLRSSGFVDYRHRLFSPDTLVAYRSAPHVLPSWEQTLLKQAFGSCCLGGRRQTELATTTRTASSPQFLRNLSMAARPPLLTRWGRLMWEDRAALDGSIVAWFAISMGILQSIPHPDCWPYVAAVCSLQLGLLVLLDYRDSLRHKVQQEASRVDPSLSVSSLMLLSSPELQNQYHRWMDRNAAVATFPCFVALFHFCAALKLTSKDGVGCKGLALISPLPATVLALARVAMEIGGAPKQTQSIASLAVFAYLETAGVIMTALKEPCVHGIGPDWTSPAGIAAFVALSTVVSMATIPCTMQHLAALCVIVGPYDFFPLYALSQRRHGGLALSSYPTHFFELGIIIAAAKAAVLLVGAAVRYRLAHWGMTGFLRSVRPHRH